MDQHLIMNNSAYINMQLLVEIWQTFLLISSDHFSQKSYFYIFPLLYSTFVIKDKKCDWKLFPLLLQRAHGCFTNSPTGFCETSARPKNKLFFLLGEFPPQFCNHGHRFAFFSRKTKPVLGVKFYFFYLHLLEK